MDYVELDVPVTQSNFDEIEYLAGNPDVAAAVTSGQITTGRAHFEHFGKHENRKSRKSLSIEGLRIKKIELFKHLLREDMQFKIVNNKFDYLSSELRKQTKIVDTDAISSHAYTPDIVALIERTQHGLMLDCGAGRRPTYYANIVNYEIVNYDTTDVIGVGEELPFVDKSFDVVISIAVLEHVRDPFRCAKELIRVLKPGGNLICSVPFLQPEHGYPHHYYNMTQQGLRSLFEDDLIIDTHEVYEHLSPVWTLTWFLGSWLQGLSGEDRSAFEGLTVKEILALDRKDLPQLDWVKNLSREKRFELACGTTIIAHKAAGSEAGPPEHDAALAPRR